MQIARESMAWRVLVMEYARIASAIPGTSRSQTARVASGVTSRIESPVPPQVMTALAWRSSAAATMAAPISSTSSCTTACEATVQPCASMSSSSAAPASSWARSRVSEHVTIEIFNSIVLLLQYGALGQIDADNIHNIARLKAARTLVDAQQAVRTLHGSE